MPDTVRNGESRADSTAPRLLDRRQALKRGAIAGGALLWAVPTIQVISMTGASAENPSSQVPEDPPSQPEPVPTDEPVPPGGSNGGNPPGGNPPGGNPQGGNPPVADPAGGNASGGNPPGRVVNAGPAGANTAGGVTGNAGTGQSGRPASLAYTGFEAGPVVLGGAGLLAAGAIVQAAAGRRGPAAEDPQS